MALKKNNIKIGYKIFLLILMIICISLGVFAPYIQRVLSDENIKTIRDYKVNELCDENIISPIDYFVIDKAKTEKLKIKAEEELIPIFTFSYISSSDK